MIRLTFFGGESRCELTNQCAPLYFSRGRADKNEPDCYYFWDFDAKEGYKFLTLKPSEIVAMELTEDSFSLEEICSGTQENEHSTSDNSSADI